MGHTYPSELRKHGEEEYSYMVTYSEDVASTTFSKVGQNLQAEEGPNVVWLAWP